MAKQKGIWIQEAKCVNCAKTGKVPNRDDPTKEDKCIFCSGTGFIRTKGTVSS